MKREPNKARLLCAQRWESPGCLLQRPWPWTLWPGCWSPACCTKVSAHASGCCCPHTTLAHPPRADVNVPQPPDTLTKTYDPPYTPAGPGQRLHTYTSRTAGLKMDTCSLQQRPPGTQAATHGPAPAVTVLGHHTAIWSHLLQ